MTAAFLALGFLVGNLTALSASPIVTALVPAIFAMVGGSILAFLSKLSEVDRPIAARAIMAFSLACLAGTYLGIIVTSHQLLGPSPSPAAASGVKSSEKTAATGPQYYLRQTDTSEIDSIDQRVRAGTLNKQDAYDRLRNILKSPSQ
jgi:hypothetical protein